MQGTNKLASSLVLAGTVILFLVGNLLYTHDSLDDPYIGYRYSRNLVRGYGLTWNPGEPPVEGYTNFLWVVLHAPFIAAGISPLFASKLLSTIAGFTLLVLIYSPLNRVVRSGIWRAMLALLIAVCPLFLFYAQSGMEHFFFTAIVFVATLLWANSRVVERGNQYRVAASVVFGIAGLTRPEGAFVFGLVWLLELWEFRGKAMRQKMGELISFSLPFACIWLPYFLWRWHYYGYPFPNTFYAKHTGNNLGNLPLGVYYVSDAFATYFLAPSRLMIGMAIAFRANAMPEGTNDRFALQRIVKPLAVMAAVYVLYVVWVGGDDTSAFPSFRLLMPIVPIIWLCLAALCQDVTTNSPTVKQALVAGLVALLCLVAFTPDALTLVKKANSDIRTTRSIADSLQSVWEKVYHLQDETSGPVVDWLLSTTKPDALIAMPWVGRVAYYADRPALDTLGLNDVHIAHSASPQQRGIDVKMDPEYVLSRRPAIIFVNVDACYWKGTCTFEEAHGWKVGDKKMIELLRNHSEYSFVPNAPTHICVFQLHDAKRPMGRSRSPIDLNKAAEIPV